MSESGFWRAGCIGLAIGSAFLLGLLAAGGSPARAEGGSAPQPGGAGANGGGATADGDRNMVAVTGTSPSGSAVLYLVDTRTKRLAVYQGTGKNIELVAMRNIEYELKLLESYHDASPEEVSVQRLRAKWLELQGGKGGNDGK